MDLATYDAYEEFGTGLDQHGRSLQAGDPRPVGWLHDDERAVRVLDAEHTGH